MKYLLIVLDGAGDIGAQTPLEIAKKPNIDKLTKNGIIGSLDIGYAKYVNSDFGFLNLLGSYSKEDYPGRGYLEALGVGLKPKKTELCIRGNFATIDENGTLIDRRAGRDETGLDDMVEKIDGMEIDGVKFHVIKSVGHRVVIMLEGKNLTQEIIPNDPLKINVPVPQVKAKNSKSKRTTSVLNKFVAKTHKILAKEPVNKKRKFPANLILIRNLGMKKKVPSFHERFGLKSACIAGVPIAKGVARFLGMHVINVKGATGKPDTDIEAKIKSGASALKKYDFVFLHINGTDILSHDGLREEKKKFLEKIDKNLEPILKINDLVIIITCDHRTVSLPNFKKYRHLMDPVPVLISGGKIRAHRIGLFSEKTAEKGFKLKGNGLLNFAFGLVENKII